MRTPSPTPVTSTGSRVGRGSAFAVAAAAFGAAPVLVAVGLAALHALGVGWAPAIGAVLACSLVTGAFLAGALARRAEAEVRDLREELERIAERGDFSLRVGADSRDGEASRLARSVNDLLAAARAREDECGTLRDELERRLEESSRSLARSATDRQEAEDALARRDEQFRQAQKMEAIGLLASGVAHDFNNLLTAILGYVQIMLRRMEADHPFRPQAVEIQRAGERASALTRQLLAFSRKQAVEPRTLDLNQVVANMSKMLRRLIGEDVELKFLPGADLWSVCADPGQLEQVIMNLAVNSRDAMPGGGRLILETANVELDESRVLRHEDVEPGCYVLLAVTDTGIGMDTETQSRIFEPFFTTKGTGKGTGLGLSTVYGIVKQAGGTIWVYSEPGRGTTFKVHFPRAHAAAAVDESRTARETPRGSETVLLVEDDDVVRDLAAEILRVNGYTVLDAPNGGVALSLCEKHPHRIDLLLTDVIMPRLNGRELGTKARPFRPDMKIVYMSGYTGGAAHEQGILDPDSPILQKPFTPDALARFVRQALDGSRGPTEARR